MQATYNITNDKLKIWFDDRLSPEDYARAKAARFTYWHGSKCFCAKWNTEAEDFIKSYGIEIKEDDAPDNIESRVERFAGYAEDAAESAESSANYLESGKANTERRQRLAIASQDKSLSLAEHWTRRIANSIRHAQYKERPDVIARRIKGLEKDLRKMEKRTRLSINPYNYILKDSEGRPVRNEKGQLKLDKESLEAAKPQLQAEQAPEIERSKRWVAHIEQRLQYERAMLEAAGGIAADNGLEIGGAIRCWIRNGNWCFITKVNKVSVEVFDPYCNWRKFWKVTKDKISETATKAQVDAGEVHVIKPEQTEA